MSIAWDLKQCNPDMTVYSIALGMWGCGPIQVTHGSRQLEWPPQAKDFSIKNYFLW